LYEKNYSPWLIFGRCFYFLCRV